MTDKPMTLLDMANVEEKKLRKGVLLAFYTDVLPSPMERVQWKNVESLGVTTAMLSQVDTPTMRHVNDAGAAWKAEFEQFPETLKVLENYFTIDPVILMNKNLVIDPRQSQIMAYTRVVNYLINDLLINGDPGVDAKNPAGLKYRLENDARFAGQSLDHASAYNVDADDAARLGWLDKIDDVLYRLDGGVASFAAINRQTHLRFRSALRVLKILDVTRDQHDREITSYRGVPFLDCGQKPAGAIVGGTTNQVIGDDTETTPAGATSSTSMYFVKLGEDNFLGLQLGGGLDVKHFGESVANPEQDKTRFRWVFGFYTGHPRCIAALRGLDIT